MKTAEDILKGKFSSSYDKLLKGSNYQKGGRLIKFTPFIDEESILRVGGRLPNANFSPAAKHPMIILSSSVVCEQLPFLT